MVLVLAVWVGVALVDPVATQDGTVWGYPELWTLTG